LLIIFFF
jgi:hypothetical protein